MAIFRRKKHLTTSKNTIYEVVFALLNATEARQPLIRSHAEQVALLAVKLGKKLGWSEGEIEKLEIASLLHDVGKIGLPDAVLRKTGTLESTDWDIIKLHPYLGVFILEPINEVQAVLPWVLHHHENWDGSGYPAGLRGTDIPEGARVISIADTFQAITSERIYRKAYGINKALSEIQNGKGIQFDPDFSDAFCEMFSEFDPGTKV